jgi:hypothetical protein
MADTGTVIALPRRPQDVELLERYRYLLALPGDINQHSQLIEPDHLAILREAIDANLRPAPLEKIRKAVALIVASFKIPSNLEDPPTFTRLMINDLAVYPADILNKAISHARRTFKWLPSIAEIVEICDQLVDERRSWLRTVDRMMEEHHRRRRKVEQEENERCRREELAARIRALHGDAVAVSPEEIELACFLRPLMHWPIGKIFAWRESLDRGELWAARHCRRLALVERARRAESKGLIPPGHAIAIARLAMLDTPAARWKLADEIGEDPFSERDVDLPRCPVQKNPDFDHAVVQLEATAWEERGIFEGDLTLPPLVQNERFGPVPACMLNFKEDPEQTAAALKRAAEVLRDQH